MSGLISQIIDDLSNGIMQDPPQDRHVAEELARIALFAKPSRFERFVPALTETYDRYSITSLIRVAHFLGQTMHESGEFQYLEELASGAAYEGRMDLGNTQPGDGRRFKGRGIIQCTGRFNYQKYSAFCRALNPHAPDFVANPERLVELPWCVDVAGWFWTEEKNLNPLADEDDLNSITRKINGGYNGIGERETYLKRAKRVLGLM